MPPNRSWPTWRTPSAPGCAFTLTGPRKAEVAATIQAIDESEGLVTFQTALPMAADKGARIELTFIQESLRIGRLGQRRRQARGTSCWPPSPTAWR